MFDATTPFGGYKSSGFGREGGPEVMENYTQYKSVWIDRPDRNTQIRTVTLREGKS
jgi:aldehyde dehydrogenase (NAD+)